MWNWVGNFKIILVLFLGLSFSGHLLAAEDEFKFNANNWDEFSKDVELQKQKDRRNGISYIISGSLALAGGILGSGIAEDGAEKAIYTIFQTIGVASVGYGAYTWQVGGEERSIYQTLYYSKLTPEQKNQYLRAYIFQKKEKEKKDRYIRAITHGLIAGLNFYNASQQKQETFKGTLYFVGSINLLAAISFTFEF